MTTITLRNYQNSLADGIRGALIRQVNCLVVRLGCGGGKTVIFSYITSGAFKKGKRVLLVAHRRELINQISLSLARFGVKHRVVTPADVVRTLKISHFKAYGQSYVDQMSGIVVGSVQTLVGRFDVLGDFDLVIIDEGHHAVEGTQWGMVVERYPRAKSLIFTATPCRLDGKGLGRDEGGYAEEMIEGPTESWLIENGYLSPYRLYTSRVMPDLSNAKHKKGGEYSDKWLADVMNKPTIIENAVEQWIEKAENRLTVAYCVSRKASEELASNFRAHGIPSAHFDSETESSERSRIVNDFADGKIRVLCNVGLLTEGFDLASIVQRDVQIDCVLDVAPTESLSLYIQKVMRCMRPRNGKVAIILDAAGNCGQMINGQFVVKHGFPDDEREWTLEGVKRKRAANDNEKAISVATCTECYHAHKPAPMCPSCGFVYPKAYRVVEQVSGDLIEISANERAIAKQQAELAKQAEQRERKREQGKAQTLEDLIALGRQRGYKYPEQWAKKYFSARQNKRA